jgi:hypothetical protein
MMGWMAEKKPGSMPKILHEQLALLKEHMKSDSSTPEPKPEEGVAHAVQEVMKRFF